MECYYLILEVVYDLFCYILMPGFIAWDCGCGSLLFSWFVFDYFTCFLFVNIVCCKLIFFVVMFWCFGSEEVGYCNT